MSEASPDGIDDWQNDVHCGDAVETLQEMPENSIHCVMTSPPYFGLRNYEVDGQIGLEETLDEYVNRLVEVGDALMRVIRPDGSWWLNLGDSFAGSGRGQWTQDEPQKESYTPSTGDFPERKIRLKRKSKMLVPHRVAIALQDRGWVVRSDAIWQKPNPLPHPVKDRLHEHKELLFHLTPQPDYWFDLDSIREPHKAVSLERSQHDYGVSGLGAMACPREDREEHVVMDNDDALHPNGKNPGDILEISVKPFSEAHFAVYPPELCHLPIKSSCPETVCAECGQPYERTVERTPLWERDSEDIDRRQSQIALEKYRDSALTVAHLTAIRAIGFGDGEHGDASQGSRARVSDEQRALADEAKDVLGGYFREFVSSPNRTTTGWEQACACDTDETEAGIVLDPFAGSGTTCLVAKQLGRRFAGIELNPEFTAMAQKRIGITVDEPERLLDDDETTLSAFTDGGNNNNDRD